MFPRMPWFSKTSLDNSIVALNFSVQVTGWFHPWGCPVVRPCIISLRLLRDFDQSHLCFAHAIFHIMSYQITNTYCCFMTCVCLLCKPCMPFSAVLQHWLLFPSFCHSYPIPFHILYLMFEFFCFIV